MAASQDISGALSGAGSGAAIGTAFGPGIGTAIGAGVGGIAGLVSGILQSSSNADQAQQNINNALAQLTAVGTPPNISAPLVLKELQSQGALTPELESYLQQATVNPSVVTDNAQTRSQLTGALQGIQAQAFGGLTPQQMANQQQLLQQTNANTQSQIQAANQSAAMRGQSGSGSQLAGMLSAIQGGAQQNSNNALQVGAQGAQAQQSAMGQYLSGLQNLRGADVSQQTTNAQLAQQANMYNAQNAAARQNYNTTAANQANQANWANQNYMNQYNTQAANQEQQRQVAAQQQQWQDQLSLAQSKANAYTGAAQTQAGMANNQNQAFNTALQGVGTAAGGIAQGMKPAAGVPAGAQNQASASGSYNAQDPFNLGSLSSP
jgi:hypothetical protein